MQPFNKKTILAVICASGVYFIVYFIAGGLTGWTGMLGKSIIFSSLFFVVVYYLKLTPDFVPIIDSIKTRLKRR